MTSGRIYIDCSALLFRYGTPYIINNSNILVTVVEDLEEDLKGYVSRDPAAIDISYVYETYLGFKAIMYYRVANAVLNMQCTTAENKLDSERVARIISEIGKLKTGVEIHPGAQIKSGFVVDHGYNTVVGQTAIIGYNCTLLNNIILGGNGIAGNPLGKRHPTLGNMVQIGAGARLFGDITIGDNCFIGPGIILNKDLPSGTKLVLKSIYEEEKINHNSQKVFSLN